jgi:type I restriction enzyme S subunit
MVREGYKETELGEIPEEWVCDNLGDIAEIIMGQSPEGASYNNDKNGIPLINGPAEFQKIHPIPVQWTTQVTKVCQIEDVLLCVRGSTTGRLNVADQIYCIGRGIAAIRGINGICSQKIIFRLIEKLQKEIFDIAVGNGSTFPNINSQDLKRFPCLVPPLPEQHRIATVLSTIDECIERTEALIAKLRLVKAGLMQDLLTRGIDSEGRIRDESTHEFKDTEIGRVPVEWEVYKIGEVLSEYYIPATMKDYEYYRLISIRRRNGGIFERERLLGKKILTKDLHHVIPGTFLIANRQIVHGACALVTENFADSYVSSAYSSLKGSENCDMSYFSCLAITPMMYNYFLNASQGVVLEKMNFHINEWLIMKIGLPNIEEQKKIVKILNASEDRIVREENYLKKLLYQKKGLMANLLTGYVRILSDIALR